MHIFLNNKYTEVPLGCTNLAQLLSAKGFAGIAQHVRINGREVPFTALHDIVLTEDMHINAENCISKYNIE